MRVVVAAGALILGSFVPASPAEPDAVRARALDVRGWVSAAGERAIAAEGLRHLRFERFGFAGGREGVTPDGTITLDSANEPRTSAPRAAHLGRHVLDGFTGEPPADPTKCLEYLRAARAAEERGDEVELRVARALGVAASPRDLEERVMMYASRCK